MKYGVIYPQTEYPPDPFAIRDYAQTVEELGYHHILTYEHVLGANPDRPGGWLGPYQYEDAFLDPFVLFSYMAAHTERIQFVTGILILPQRKTAVVANQAASLERLSGGRFRLGIGVGWNKVEYIALGEDFHQRGQRVEEQIAVLRQLWTKPLVTFEGQFHHIPDAGINPLPRHLIPIWLGGSAPVVLDRLARTGDGWFPNYRDVADARESFDILNERLAAHGRSRDDIGIEARMYYKDGPDGWQKQLAGWEEAGATHISVNTMGAGLTTPDAHLNAIRDFAQEVGFG